MNPTDAEIAGMKEELSQAVYLIGKYLNETPLGNQPHMIAGPAQQWLEQRRKRSLAEQVDGEKDNGGGKPQYNVPWTFSASS